MQSSIQLVAGAMQSSIQLVAGALIPGVKREADNLPPSSAEVKNVWRYTHTYSWRGA